MFKAKMTNWETFTVYIKDNFLRIQISLKNQKDNDNTTKEKTKTTH